MCNFPVRLLLKLNETLIQSSENQFQIMSVIFDMCLCVYILHRETARLTSFGWFWGRDNVVIIGARARKIYCN